MQTGAGAALALILVVAVIAAIAVRRSYWKVRLTLWAVYVAVIILWWLSWRQQ